MSRQNQDVYVRKDTCWTFAKEKAIAMFAYEEIARIKDAAEKRRLSEFSKSSFLNQMETYKKSRKN